MRPVVGIGGPTVRWHLQRGDPVEINGVATSSRGSVGSRRFVVFYDALMPRLRLEAIYRSDDLLYYLGGRTAVGDPPAGTGACRSRSRGSWRPVSTTSASVLVDATTLTSWTCGWESSGRRSCEPRRKGRGHRAITRCRSGIPRGSAWRSTTFRVKACSRTGRHSPPSRIIRSQVPTSSWLTVPALPLHRASQGTRR